MKLAPKPGFYFKLMILAILLASIASLYGQKKLNREAKTMLYHNLEEIQRGHKAYSDFLIIKADFFQYYNNLITRNDEQLVSTKNHLKRRFRSLDKELGMWNQAIVADLTGASGARQESERGELGRLNQLMNELDIYYADINLFLDEHSVSTSDSTKVTSDFGILNRQLSNIETKFKVILRSTTAESYIELEEFEYEIADTFSYSLAIVSTLFVLSLLFYHFEIKLYFRPLRRIRGYINERNNEMRKKLDIAEFGVYFAQMQDDFTALVELGDGQTELIHEQSIEHEKLSRLIFELENVNQKVLDSINEGIIKTALSGEIITFNQALVRLLDGFNLSSVRNVSSAIMFRKPNGEQVDLMAILKQFSDRYTSPVKEHWLLQANDTARNVKVAMYPLDDSVLIVITDISELISQEAQLGFVSQIYDALAQPMWITDSNWLVKEVNLAVCNRYGSDKNKLSGKELPWFNDLKAQTSLYQKIERELLQSGLWRGQLVIEGKELTLAIQKLSHSNQLKSFYAIIEHI